MARRCTICSSSHRRSIDKDILVGSPLRTIADRWSVSKTALIRHRDHLSRTLLKAQEAAQVEHADSLLEQLNHLTADARRIQEKAERARDYRAALAGIRELARIVDLVARLTGQIQQHTETNIVNFQIDEKTAARMAS